MESNIFKNVLPDLITEKDNGFFMIEELKSIKSFQKFVTKRGLILK